MSGGTLGTAVVVGALIVVLIAVALAFGPVLIRALNLGGI